jgi:hypothetical protein
MQKSGCSFLEMTARATRSQGQGVKTLDSQVFFGTAEAVPDANHS